MFICSPIKWFCVVFSSVLYFVMLEFARVFFYYYYSSSHHENRYRSILYFSGRMLVDELEEAIETSIEDGITPLFVNATCGTTVLGAFDPVEAIADVCQKYDIWMHVDVSIDNEYNLKSKSYRRHCILVSKFNVGLKLNLSELNTAPKYFPLK